MKKKNISFDVMMGDLFVATLRMPITLDVIKSYVGDELIIKEDAYVKFTLKKMPTLKGKDFQIYLN